MILSRFKIAGLLPAVGAVCADCGDPARGQEAWRGGGEQPGPAGGEEAGVPQAEVQAARLQLQVRVQGGVHREAGLQDNLPVQVQGVQETGTQGKWTLYSLT